MKGLFIFAAGLVTGAIAGAYLVKDKVMADAKEEINEVREYYKSKKEDNKEKEPHKEEVKVEEEHEEPEEPEEFVEEEKEEYKEITKNYTTYTNYTNYVKPEQPSQAVNNDTPYVIDPEEFGEEEGYDTMTLTYFADGVLIDDVDEVIEDKDTVVGLENLKIFDEFDASSVYVRNDIWKTDFEILKDDWNWSDLQEPKIEKKPHQL